jgi:Protein of unknown function (DUF3969)
MTNSKTAAIEKALLLVTIGFLEALRSGVIAADEAFYTIGIPKITGRMEDHGVSPRVMDLVSQLDEFEDLETLGGEAVWLASVGKVISECKAILSEMPCDRERPEPILRLFE